MTKHNILSHYRLIGDHPADLLIQSLVDENGIEYIRSLFPFFSNYKDLSFGNLDPLIQDFLKVNSNLPASFDKKNMIRLLIIIEIIRKILDLYLVCIHCLIATLVLMAQESYRSQPD